MFSHTSEIQIEFTFGLTNWTVRNALKNMLTEFLACRDSWHGYKRCPPNVPCDKSCYLKRISLAKERHWRILIQLRPINRASATIINIITLRSLCCCPPNEIKSIRGSRYLMIILHHPSWSMSSSAICAVGLSLATTTRRRGGQEGMLCRRKSFKYTRTTTIKVTRVN